MTVWQTTFELRKCFTTPPIHRVTHTHTHTHDGMGRRDGRNSHSSVVSLRTRVGKYSYEIQLQNTFLRQAALCHRRHHHYHHHHRVFKGFGVLDCSGLNITTQKYVYWSSCPLYFSQLYRAF
jgi:hypothetical protein